MYHDRVDFWLMPLVVKFMCQGQLKNIVLDYFGEDVSHHAEVMKWILNHVDGFLLPYLKEKYDIDVKGLLID